MVGHALVGIFGCDSLDQFGRVRVSRNNGAAARFSPTQRLFSEDKGDPVLLANSSVAGDTILIENRADIPAEIDSISRKPASYVGGNQNEGSNRNQAYSQLQGTNPVLDTLKHSQSLNRIFPRCSEHHITTKSGPLERDSSRNLHISGPGHGSVRHP